MSAGQKAQGTLIIIGGHEDKRGERAILKRVVEGATGDGRLVVITAASNLPREEWQEYEKAFGQLGVKNIEVLEFRTREDGFKQENVEAIKGASVIFFTGGDQLRITSQVGDSPVFRCIQELYDRGATLAGTSAGAAAMPETMIIGGESDESNKVSALDMAPGLGFLPGVVIDSHFAERGRMGRLLGAVAENPKNIGLGIDENTAIVVGPDNMFTVLGTGALYVVDGRGITYSSLSDKHPEGIVSIYDVKLHVLGSGDCFDLNARRPEATPESVPSAAGKGKKPVRAANGHDDTVAERHGHRRQEAKA